MNCSEEFLNPIYADRIEYVPVEEDTGEVGKK